MRILISMLCFFSILVAGNCQSASASTIDVLHYNFRITLSDSTDKIEGIAAIELRLLSTSNQVVLDLSSVSAGKGMTVNQVSENEKPLESHQEEGKLLIQLPAGVKPGDSVRYVISYSGIPADGLIISKNKFGHRTFFADNWPNRGHNWIPCHDDPADKASVAFTVIAPEHYQIVANGIQLEETNLGNHLKLTRWDEEVPISTKVMVIGAADFAVNLSGFVGCIPVYSWVYPEERDKGFYDYAQANEILPFFIDRVGPYGYKKLANVESKTVFGGLENANTIFYSEKTITGTRAKEDLLVHEIAHQWFGNMATEKTFAHLWLSEGFATYFTDLYFETRYGEDTMRKMLIKDRKETVAYSHESSRPVVDEATSDYMQLLNDNSYQKGSWVLHMLRRQLGDSIFWQSIRSYYSTYAGKNANTDDLRVIFETVSGKDLQAFFKQWLYTAGQPELSIAWKNSGKNKLSVTVIQNQKSIFDFPLELALLGADGTQKIEKLQIIKKEEQFTLESSGKVIRVLADPAVKMLLSASVIAAK